MKYKYIQRLGLKIYSDPYPHIISKDIEGVLDKKATQLFHKYFGVQTSILRKDGRIGMYPCDVEAVLVRIFENRLTGTQLLPD